MGKDPERRIIGVWETIHMFPGHIPKRPHVSLTEAIDFSLEQCPQSATDSAIRGAGAPSAHPGQGGNLC